MFRSKTLNWVLPLVAVTVCAGTQAAAAPLLIDPSGGTTLWTNVDDDVVNRNLGFTGHFFGVLVNSVDVSVNGNLNFDADISLTNQALPFGPARISPLWDDWFLSGAPGQSISEKIAPGVYYSVTYSNIETFNTGSQFTFQTVWFGAATMIGGFDFRPDDIVFVYGMIGGTLNDANATAGLNAGDGATFAPLPGTTDGSVTSANKDALLVLGPQFVLFRPTIFGDYTASIESFVPTTQPVPEPGSAWLFGMAVISLTGGSRFLRGRFRPK